MDRSQSAVQVNIARKNPIPMNQENLAPFLWNIADLLLGRFKPSEDGRIILPFNP